jgi:HPt (histidine-containing phosphotransfer) domain-containing protein
MSPNSLPQDLDLSFLLDIADGSNEFIVESIEMFMVQTPELLQMISTGIAANDWTTVTAAAHKLKPNLGFFGMPICQATIQEVEIMAKGGATDPELLKEKFAEVKAILAENLISLEKIKAEKAALL